MNKNGKGGFNENPQNINTKGRPKGSLSIPDKLREIGDQEWKSVEGDIIGKKLDMVLKKVFDYALEGRSWAVQFIADRTEGKALERIDQTINQKPIKVFDIDE